MPVADEDLRNGASIAACNHLLAILWVVLDVDFLESHFFSRQQSLRPLAIRTPVGHKQRHLGRRHRGRHGGRHGECHFELPLPPGEVFANGKLSFTQAFKPPCRLNTLVKPSFISVRAPLAPLTPLSQYVITFLSRHFLKLSACEASSATGTLRASPIWPASYNSLPRRSMTSAP